MFEIPNSCQCWHQQKRGQFGSRTLDQTIRLIHHDVSQPNAFVYHSDWPNSISYRGKSTTIHYFLVLSLFSRSSNHSETPTTLLRSPAFLPATQYTSWPSFEKACENPLASSTSQAFSVFQFDSIWILPSSVNKDNTHHKHSRYS